VGSTDPTTPAIASACPSGSTTRGAKKKLRADCLLVPGKYCVYNGNECTITTCTSASFCPGKVSIENTSNDGLKACPACTTTGFVPYSPEGATEKDQCGCEFGCTNGKQNGDETDVDCGGSCSTKCADSKVCALPGDCASGNCWQGKCVSCSDGVKNGDETDVDCGGSCSTKCADSKVCALPGDCASGNCWQGKCVSCSDVAKNGDETDVDCGGSCSTKCAALMKCSVDSDCVTGKCRSDKVCDPLVSTVGARLPNLPLDVAFDSSGNVYCLTDVDFTVRVAQPDGTWRAIAAFTQASRIALDDAGNIWVTLSTANQVAKIASLGKGNFLAPETFQMPGLPSPLNFPLSITTDANGAVYIGDRNARVLKVDRVTGTVLSVILLGPGFHENVARCITVDTSGQLLYISDTWNHRIMKWAVGDAFPSVYMGGNGLGNYIDGLSAAGQQLHAPVGLVFDRWTGDLFFGDLSRRVARIDANTKVVTTVAGVTGSVQYTTDGIPATTAPMEPRDVDINRATGALVIADLGNKRIRKVAI
jgi:hypothetical protein